MKIDSARLGCFVFKAAFREKKIYVGRMDKNLLKPGISEGI